ncbi:glycosyltransferase family 2 protein [Xanthocytophaga agilis]|uniref:Glycosyltransferase family 2 protein n=1 Tax=Xanthocytophaga agilis TaxID=3048010 RepID=A0AAE3UHU4_9BACT|nr:glycosyltransferase family 2 protein [Xanthocytophaga agilis]MDJ1504661.1 glycosyltransferase family 2 protein [Xanthocytophaga agilis]
MEIHNTIFFSIIIPTYNRASFLPATLQSLLKQTFKDYEVIVVDDGSTDNTEEVMKGLTDDHIRYYKKENGERAAARNFGIKQARGQYITFLDSDDIFYEQCLSNAYESILKFENPPLLHVAYEVTDRNLKSKVKVNNLVSDDIYVLVKGNPLSCMGVFLRRDIANTYQFTEDRALAGSEDWELWLRVVANVGIKVDNRVSAALIDHDSRSVKHFVEGNLVERKELALRYAFEDETVKKIFSPYWKKINSYCDSYIALHLVLGHQYRKGLSFWFTSLLEYPLSLFERRSMAIVKYSILGLLKR